MLRARVVTALFLAVGFLSIIFLLPAVWAVAVFALVITLAAWEWAALLRAGPWLRYGFPAFILLSCLLIQMTGISLVPLWSIAVAFWLWVPWLLRCGWCPGSRSGYLVGILLLIPAWAALSNLISRSPLLLLLVMSSVWVADIAAYFAGRKFGKHKLAPTISPGKTWEGAWGGLFGVVLYGMAVSFSYPKLDAIGWQRMLPFLFVLTAFSIFGDLFESMIKRQAGMKDSSQLLPGHGGILDRVDSQLSVLPLVSLTLHWTGQ